MKVPLRSLYGAFVEEDPMPNGTDVARECSAALMDSVPLRNAVERAPAPVLTTGPTGPATAPTPDPVFDNAAVPSFGRR